MRLQRQPRGRLCTRKSCARATDAAEASQRGLPRLGVAATADWRRTRGVCCSIDREPRARLRETAPAHAARVALPQSVCER